MASDPHGFDPRGLWQGQNQENDPMTLAQLHAKARVFQARIRRRNLIEYAAAAVVIVGFLPSVFHHDGWMIQAGSVLVILAALFVVWQLHRRGAAQPVPDGGEGLRAAYRAELARQRDLMRSVALWYLAPPIPGLLLLMLGRWFQVHAAHRSIAADHLIIALATGLAAVVFLGIWLLNQRSAARLQRRIDEL